MKYRKKPVEVEAFRFRNEEFPSWFLLHKSVEWPKEMNDCVYIKTIEGTMKAVPGDYIIRGVQGEIYPCKKAIFDLTYEKVE